ncbi:MAG: UDP-N-acetylglucosamine--N-acetylmuramyl-(pentapeptide) pyrophosphoryl-undecaprenol N-acetylglucosamine transferase [Candidatus Bipolaricaulis sp.]|nr:UDP-N-acetylglucosamine--N-acetylmuramyl-(pentapeptide) pyrophosphoryl-undecaprenol N-acetylglucosamine transferase [Candidatus Bipolaricaulis sp.]
MMRILIAGGGTGGHVYPAMALIQGLRQRLPEARVAYVGTRRGLEARAVREYPWVRFFAIHARGLDRDGRIPAARAGGWLAVSFVETLVLLFRLRPRVVVGVGGYSSFAPVFLSALLGRIFPIRTAIHEQNAVPGLANRWLSRFVDVVLVSYPMAAGTFPRARRVVVTGNPVREEFLRERRCDAAYREFGLDPRRRTVLVFGGSNGSPELVDQILGAKEALGRRSDLQLLLVTGGSRPEDDVRRELTAAGVENVQVRRYVDRMATAFAVADLIVARAGATTLAEITTCGKPAVLVPWRGAADDHQWENARVLERAEACRLADTRALGRGGLAGEILRLAQDDAALVRLGGNARRLGQRQANARILGEIQALVRGARA